MIREVQFSSYGEVFLRLVGNHRVTYFRIRSRQLVSQSNSALFRFISNNAKKLLRQHTLKFCIILSGPPRNAGKKSFRLPVSQFCFNNLILLNSYQGFYVTIFENAFSCYREVFFSNKTISFEKLSSFVKINGNVRGKFCRF